jgi:hypothetical protein
MRSPWDALATNVVLRKVALCLLAVQLPGNRDFMGCR